MSYNIPKNLLDISSSNSLLLEDGSILNPAISFDSQTNMGITRAANYQLGLVAGLNKGAVVGMSFIHIGASSYYGWRSADAIGQGAGNETRLRRDDKGILGITTYDDSPTGLNLYNTYTDASNYERLEVKWDSDYAVIATAANGTGSNRTIQTSNLEIRGRTSTTETYLSLKRDNDTSVITVQSNGAGVTRIQGDHTFDVTTDTTTGTLSLGNYNGRHGVQITNEGYNVGIGRVVPAVNGVTIGRSEHPVMLNGSGTFIYNNNNVDETNYERLEIGWGSDVVTIGSTAAGTGTRRQLCFDGSSVLIKAAGINKFNVSSAINYSYQTLQPGSDSAHTLGTGPRRWSTTYTDSIAIGQNTLDAVLTADAADTLALRNGTNAQTQRVYRSYTDASNNEGMEFLSDTFNRINSFANGTGSLGSIEIQVGGSRRFRGDSSFAYIQGQTGGYIFYGSDALKPQSANDIDLGGTSNRWNNTYSVNGDFSGDLTISGAEKKLVLSGQSSAFNTTSHASTVYNSDDDGGSYPFTSVGNLILQSRATAFRDIVFVTGSSTPAVRMVVASAGNVGIGINVPTSPLHVVGNIHNTGTITTDGGFADLLAVSGTSAPELRINSTDSAIFDGDEFGRLQWYMNDANSNGTGATARISAIFNDTASGSPAQQTAGEGTDLVFSTGLVLVTGQTQTVTEKLRIDKNGTFKHAVGTNSYWYNLDTDASNYERFKLGWESNDFVISAEADGSGSVQDLDLVAKQVAFKYNSGTGVSTRISAGSDYIKMWRNMYPGSDSNYNCGIPANRWNVVCTDSIIIGNGVDAALTADANNHLALRNGTSAQQFSIYNTYTDASNYERLEIKWDSDVATIGATGDGTGTARQVRLGDSGTHIASLAASNQVKVSAGGNTLFVGLSTQIQFYKTILPNNDATAALGTTAKRWSNTFTDKITIGNGTDAILNGDGTGKIYMGNDSSQLTQFAVRGEDDGAGNYNQLEMRMAFNGACGLYSTGYGTQTPSGLSIYHNNTKTFEFTSTQLYIHKPFRPTSAGSEPLGTSSVPFGNLYINTSSKIYFNNAQLLGSRGGSGIVLEQRNGTTEQRYYLYNTYTDDNNYERLEMKWDTNVAYIENTNNGSGALRELYIGSNSQGNIRFGASGNIIRFSIGSFSATKMYLNSSGLTLYGNYLPQGNGTRSIGSDSARFKKAYINGMLSGTETFTATDTLDDQNQVCLCNATSGNITLNLPVASSSIAGTQYQIKKIDSSSNTVIITPNSGAGDLIDGSATYTLSNQWEGAIIVCDGADWFITGGVTNSGGGGGGGGGLGGGD